MRHPVNPAGLAWLHAQPVGAAAMQQCGGLAASWRGPSVGRGAARRSGPCTRLLMRVLASGSVQTQLSDGPSTSAPSLPKTFKQLVAARAGSSFRDVAVVKEVALQLPGPGEVLVRMKHWGINGGCETFRARGEHAFAANQARSDFLLGAEGSGVVVAVGEGVKGLQVGTPVACNSTGFAEYGIAKAQLCTAVERADAEAAALVLSGVTAAVALEVTAKMKAGETVVVTAAAGGTGHFAVQLALLAGCRVVALCRGKHKAEALRALGVQSIIDYGQEPDLDAALSRELGPGGADVVYEGVGGALQRTLLRHLAPAGCLLQVGYISEYPHNSSSSSSGGSSSSSSGSSSSSTQQEAPAAVEAGGAGAPGGEVPPCARLFWQGLNVQRGEQQIIGQIWPRDPVAIAHCRRRVFALHREGKLRALVDSSHRFVGLGYVPEAVDHMLRGQHVGKVCVAAEGLC